MSNSPVRWGILGCGRIAGAFAEALELVPGAELVAVGSRTAENAKSFGAKHGVGRYHGSYAALAEDSTVDAIYVATPHPMHADDTVLCLQNGKAALTEKPFTVNAAQAQRAIAAAQSAKLFLMEAHWSRFVPMMREVVRLVAAGAIGEPRSVHADFGFRAGFDPANRLFDLNLGGGALLDVGCYCVSLAVMLFGAPSTVSGLADIGSTGVDEQSSMNLLYPDGKLAVLSTAIRTNTQHEAVICGASGRIHLHSPWWKVTDITIHRDGSTPERLTIPADGNGFCYEIVEAMRCIRAGEIESPIMPHSDTIEIMRIMDSLRAQWGLVYPCEL